MDLLEYIKISMVRPNRAVLKGLGANEELIEYLMKSPWNTNINVVKTLLATEEPTPEPEPEPEPEPGEVILSKIEVTNEPTKTVYTVGDTFDITGMTVVATYSNDATELLYYGIEYTTVPANGEVITGEDIDFDEPIDVIVSYTEGGVTCTDKFSITINQA